MNKFEVVFDPFYGIDMIFEKMFNLQKLDTDGNTIDIDVPKFAALLHRTTRCQRIEKLTEQYGNVYGSLDMEAFYSAQEDHAAINKEVQKSAHENFLIFQVYD